MTSRREISQVQCMPQAFGTAHAIAQPLQTAQGCVYNTFISVSDPIPQHLPPSAALLFFCCAQGTGAEGATRCNCQRYPLIWSAQGVRMGNPVDVTQTCSCSVTTYWSQRESGSDTKLDRSNPWLVVHLLLVYSIN